MSTESESVILDIVGDADLPNAHAQERERRASALPPEQEPGFGDLRHYVPQDILNVTFPVAVRGYDRRAVDAYTKRVNRAIAELKVSASPPAAVRRALEQAGQQVHGLLQSARETAEEITASARQEAEESTARAKAEAVELVVNSSAEADRVIADANAHLAKAKAEAEETIAKASAKASEIVTNAQSEADAIRARSRAEADDAVRRLHEELAEVREQAEARMRDIQADTQLVWERRRELFDDIRAVATSLVDSVDAAAARLPGGNGEEREQAAPESGTVEEIPPSHVATSDATPAAPAGA